MQVKMLILYIMCKCTLFLTGIPKFFASKVLIDVDVNDETESGFNVTCVFRSDVRNPACVVSYRREEENQTESGSTPQTKDLNSDSIFPSTIPVDKTGEYFVTVFGKLGEETEEVAFLTSSVIVNLPGV